MAQITDVSWSPDTGFSVTRRPLQFNAPANHHQCQYSDQRGQDTGMEQRRKRSYPTPVQGVNSKICTISLDTTELLPGCSNQSKRRYFPKPNIVRAEHSDAPLMPRRGFVGSNTMCVQSTKILHTEDRSNSTTKNIDRGVPGNNTLVNKNRKEIPKGFNQSKQDYVPTPRPNLVQIRSNSNTVRLATERSNGPLMAGRRSESSATMSELSTKVLETANLSDSTTKNIVKSVAENNPRVPKNRKETAEDIARPVKVAGMHTKKTQQSERLKANNYSKSFGAINQQFLKQTVPEMKKTLITNGKPLAGYRIPKMGKNATNNVEAGTDATVNGQQNVPSNPNEPKPVEETSENIAYINNANTSAKEANQTNRDTTQFNSQSQHIEHLKNESGRRADGTTKAKLYKCPLCPLHFSNKNTAKRHRDVDDHSMIGLECNDCGYQFYALDRHGRIYHTEKNNLGANDFFVTILPKLVYNNYHMQVHKPFKMDDNMKPNIEQKMAHNVEHRPDNNKEQQIQEIKTFFEVYQCFDCTLCHTDIKGVNRHIDSNECLDIITYECTICHWQFDEASHLLHRKQHFELRNTGYYGNQGFDLIPVRKPRILETHNEEDKGAVDGCKADTNKTVSAETDASQSLKDQGLLARIDLLNNLILIQNRKRDIEIREAETERAKNRQREKASKIINRNKTTQYNIVMQTQIKNKHVTQKYKNVAKERESRR